MDMDEKIVETLSRNNHHLVLVPCPLQGHINPMLHLANVFRSRGFPITIIHTKSIPIVLPSSHHDFLFESIDDSLSEDERSSSSKDVISFLFNLNLKCKAGFRDCLARIIADRSRDLGLVCIIFDAAMYFSGDVATEFKVPKLVLRTSTAANFLGLSLLNQRGSLPDQGEFHLILNMDSGIALITSHEVKKKGGGLHIGRQLRLLALWLADYL